MTSIADGPAVAVAVPVEEPATLPTYEIRAELLDELGKRVAKVNRRLARAGATDEFTYTVEEFVAERRNDAEDRTDYVQMARVTLSAPQITAPGYTFVAALTREAAGMVVRTAPGQSLDGWTRPDDHRCDYCGTSRSRSTSYVVRNDATGEVVQIGKSCLVPFLGVSPGGLWALQFDPDELIPATTSSGRTAVLYPVRELLALAWVVTDNGRRYLSRAIAAEREEMSTASEVLYVYHWSPIGRDAWREAARIEALRRAARAVDPVIVDELLAEADALDPDTDFGANARIAVDSHLISHRSVGYLVSLIAVRNRRLRAEVVAREREADRAAIVDEWLGAEGDKLTDLDVTIRAAIRVDGYAYNSTDTIVIMRADTGHVLKWKTSGEHPEIEPGYRFHIRSARVKTHGEYKDVKQTIVKLVKMNRIDDPADEG